MSNSTVSGNSSTQLGGGISIGSGTATMANITVSNNTSQYGRVASAAATPPRSADFRSSRATPNVILSKLSGLGDPTGLPLGRCVHPQPRRAGEQRAVRRRAILPGPGSAAINAYSLSLDAPQTDQRGLIRPTQRGVRDAVRHRRGGSRFGARCDFRRRIRTCREWLTHVAHRGEFFLGHRDTDSDA